MTRDPKTAQSGSTGGKEPVSTASWRSSDGVYSPGQRTMVKVKHERTIDCVVAGFRWHKDGKGIGSLLLGLYDDDGDAAPHRGHRAASRWRSAPN